MRKIFIVLAIMMMIVGLQVSYAAGTDGSLCGLWLFDEGKGDVVEDSSENGNDGETSNCEWVEGRYGSALEFNGTSSCVTIPHSESLSIEEDKISIIAWFMQDGNGSGTWHTVVCKGPMLTGQVTENWAVFTNSQEQYICTTLTMDGGERWWTTSGAGTVPVDGEWRHFATTYDGEELNYYLDGELVNTEPKNGDLLPNEEALTIGCRSNDGTPWGGMLDEIAIFRRALSQQEIKNIMENGLTTFLAVEPAGKLSTVWGNLKTECKGAL